MDVDPIPKGRDGFGVIAYRWIVTALVGITLYGVAKTYDKIDKTFDGMAEINRAITALNGRLDAQAERLAAHDRRFERIEDRVFINPRGMP